MRQNRSIYSFVYELAVLLFVLFLLFTPIHALNTKHLNILETLPDNKVLIKLDSDMKVKIGQTLPIFRYNETWQKKLGDIVIEKISSGTALASFNPQKFVWPMGRHGQIINSSGANASISLGSSLGFKSGDRLIVFDSRKNIGKLEITKVSKNKSLAKILYSPQGNQIGLTVSEYAVATQAVLFQNRILSLVELFLILLTVIAHSALFIFRKKSLLKILAKRFKKILNNLPRNSLKLLLNLIFGALFIWFMANLIIYFIIYLSNSNQILNFRPFLYLAGVFWYTLYFLKKKRSPILAFWSFLSYGNYKSEPKQTIIRRLMIWIGSLIIFYVFAINLIGFLRANNNEVLNILGKNRISNENIFEVLRYSLWSLTILVCFVGYSYSLVSFIWGKYVRNLDFTITGWLTNGFCYPLFGVIIWQMVPPLRGSDPIIASGIWRYFMLCLELFLNLLYTASIINLGLMFGLMSDKGLRTSGFFSVIRHPNYTLESMMFVVLFSGGLSAAGQWIAIGMYLFIYFLRSEREDNFMNYSNPGYAGYKKQTPSKFIPGLY